MAAIANGRARVANEAAKPRLSIKIPLVMPPHGRARGRMSVRIHERSDDTTLHAGAMSQDFKGGSFGLFFSARLSIGSFRGQQIGSGARLALRRLFCLQQRAETLPGSGNEISNPAIKSA
jgi:hypothetical protein